MKNPNISYVNANGDEPTWKGPVNANWDETIWKGPIDYMAARTPRTLMSAANTPRPVMSTSEESSSPDGNHLLSNHDKRRVLEVRVLLICIHVLLLTGRRFAATINSCILGCFESS